MNPIGPFGFIRLIGLISLWGLTGLLGFHLLFLYYGLRGILFYSLCHYGLLLWLMLTDVKHNQQEDTSGDCCSHPRPERNETGWSFSGSYFPIELRFCDIQLLFGRQLQTVGMQRCLT